MGNVFLYKELSQIIHEISQYSPGKLDQLFEEEIQKVSDPHLIKNIQELGKDIEESQYYCRLLGIYQKEDYNTSNNQYHLRSLSLAYTLIKRNNNQKFILPCSTDS